MRSMVVAAALCSAIVTAVFAASPLRFAYDVPDLRILLETVQAMTAGLVAFLLFGRFHRTRSRNDGFLVYSLTLLAITNLFFALLPALTDGTGPLLSRFSTWAPLTARSLASVALVAAALLPNRPSRSRFTGLSTFGTAAATAVAIGVVAAVAVRHLPVGVVATATDSSRPDLDAHAAVSITQLVVAGVDAAAAIGFMARATRERDLLFGSLAVAMVLSSFSRVNYFLYPSLYSNVVHVGDFFRLAGYVVLLVGAGVEIERYWRAQTEAAAAGERRRIARELHDGLTQELAFIRSHMSSLATGEGHLEMLPHLAEAAERAHVEARKVLDVLDSGGHGALEEELGTAVRELGRREGVEVVVAGRAPALPAEAQAELVRIACEATTNAVRHGRPRQVDVRLAADGPALLVVHDNGQGFDPAAVDGRGYGMRSMESRAQAIGAQLRVRSTIGEGTTVEVRWT